MTRVSAEPLDNFGLREIKYFFQRIVEILIVLLLLLLSNLSIDSVQFSRIVPDLVQIWYNAEPTQGEPTQYAGKLAGIFSEFS